MVDIVDYVYCMSALETEAEAIRRQRREEQGRRSGIQRRRKEIERQLQTVELRLLRR